MKFRTTIGNGLVAIGQGNTHFSLQLKNGRLNLHSNLISKYEGIIIGENLNNTKWQKVYVAVNASHLTLGVNDQLQATQPINPSGDNDTVFFNFAHLLAWAVRSPRRLHWARTRLRVLASGRLGPGVPAESRDFDRDALYFKNDTQDSYYHSESGRGR